ncbi:DNA-binding domain-containing protein [Catenovulum agarivorans]|uniref:HvfC family RiPP maturation protein n=1 Tax=Catenovulum agarivorans TaxID=1172192 RepID=UPI0003051D1B|nr:putative DNA-binding domain-containing protein [Catenovulum agarivorans]
MSSFKHLQFEFADAIRQGKAAINNIEQRRLTIYQELFFNNILDFVSNAFPVLKSLYSQQAWSQLIRQFFIEHTCTSAHFVDIPAEFLQFLTEQYQVKQSDPVFIKELAHYEWIELAVTVQVQTQDKLSLLSANEITSEKFNLSPLARVISYPYPVHKISKKFQPVSSSEPIYLIIYRDADFKVKFIEINAAIAFMLDLLAKQVENSFEGLVTQLQLALPHVEKTLLRESLHSNLVEFSQLTLLVKSE